MFILHYDPRTSDSFQTLLEAQRAACIYAENILFVKILNAREKPTLAYKSFRSLIDAKSWEVAYNQIKHFFPIEEQVDNQVAL